MRAENFLLEIGTEELPPKSLKQLMIALHDEFCRELDKRGFSYGSTRAYATPRRLVVAVDDLAEYQSDQEIEKRGPSVKAAYSEDGEPTRALLGFARACQVDDVSSLERLVTAKGEWVVFRQTQAGRPFDGELEAIVSAAMADLPVERKMRWGDGRTEFVRPVHWVVALYGKDIIDATILGHHTGRQSRGHRFMHPGPIELESANSYIEACRQASVIADFEERRSIIATDLERCAEQLGASVDLDPDLLDEVASLVEWPRVVTGRFDADYLKIPDEVLVSAMKGHQRYFPIRTKTGDLLPQFATVANIASTDEPAVIHGNERVIRPRLADAAFFFNKDTKTTLEEKLPRLSQVVFQTKLGTYSDKADRIAALSGFIAGHLGASAADAARAGLLCKADLISDLVGEFPDLQGVMGGHYATWDKEPREICEAIRMHYHPTSSGGSVPTTPLACCVAIADKLDSLVGIFGIGQPPTGSRDPYALRRQALGVIRIIVENSLPLNLGVCLAEAARLHQYQYDVSGVHEYILDRHANWYQDLGFHADVIAAIRLGTAGADDLSQADQRIRALQEFKQHDHAANLIAANKRVANILKQSPTDSQSSINVDLFDGATEAEMFDALCGAEQKFSATDEYSERLLVLADQQQHIDRYFDDVLVMADDAPIRRNRLATVARMRKLFLEVADFSVLQTP